MAGESLDLLVIGSGPGGYRAAVLGALRGLRVAIVERQDWGGCCLNRGCIPKKAWYHTAHTVARAQTAAARGLRGEWRVDFAAAWQHQERVVKAVQDSYLDYMKRLGIRALVGHARFESASRIRVDRAAEQMMIDARHVIIATGSTFVPPPQLPLHAGRVLSTDMLFDVPPPLGARVAVIGGGVIATEFAFILQMLGRDVVWITRRKPLARTAFSVPARTALDAAFRDLAIAPRLASVTRCRVNETAVHLSLDDGAEITVDWALVATGRVPYTAELNLAAAGVDTTGEGYIRVNSQLQTDMSSVYAIGDCIGPTLTANQALADAAVAIDNIVAQKGRPRETRWVPEVVYSALELARVGLNEDAAEAADLEPAIGFSAFETSPRALGEDDVRGFVRLLGDMDSGALLGGEIVGTDAGELIHALSLFPTHEAALAWLARGRFNHPTRAEELLNAAETLASKWGLMSHIFAD